MFVNSVLCYLIMRSDNDTHTCFPSEKGIARACGISNSTVTRVVKSSESKQLIKVKRQYAATKNGMNRQTANLYEVLIYKNIPHNHTEAPPSSEKISPLITETREINKTIPNITKSNITKSTELSLDAAVDLEKERFSFMELKKDCFEALKNEKGIDEEYVLLLDRALEHLWFKNEAEYEGRKYAQDELRAMLKDKVTPAILGASVEFLEHSKESYGDVLSFDYLLNKTSHTMRVGCICSVINKLSNFNSSVFLNSYGHTVLNIVEKFFTERVNNCHFCLIIVEPNVCNYNACACK